RRCGPVPNRWSHSRTDGALSPLLSTSSPPCGSTVRKFNSSTFADGINTWGQPPSAVRSSHARLVFQPGKAAVEPCSTGQPRAAFPTRFLLVSACCGTLPRDFSFYTSWQTRAALQGNLY